MQTTEMQIERLRRAARHAGEVFACMPDAETGPLPPGPDDRPAGGLVVPGVSAEVRTAAVRRRFG